MKRSFRLVTSLLVIICLSAFTALARAQTVADLIPSGKTYNRAQVLSWLDGDRFLIARWDGTLTIFRCPSSTESGPILTQALMLPSGWPVEMVCPFSRTTFITSNNDRSLAVWRSNNSKYRLSYFKRYSSRCGTANSASILASDGKQWLVTGHSEGYINIWRKEGPNLQLHRTISVRSANPIPSPWKLWNIRSIVPWENGTIITGSEDGDICIISVPHGVILKRMRYNPMAQRGINAMSICKDYLALVNCSVGTDDKNLWLYKVGTNQIVTLDSLNLTSDSNLNQVFNFSVQLASSGNDIYYFASTQEGLLWMGKIINDKLTPLKKIKIAGNGGGALAFKPQLSMLSVTAFDIELFTLTPKP